MADTKQTEIPEIKLISDAEIKSFEADYLEFDKYSNILCGIAKGTTGPFTVGVYGDWGSGKTSVLRLLQENLKKESNTITVWFNAWQYENEEHIVFSLLATIIDEIPKDKKTWEFWRKNGIKNIWHETENALRSIAFGTSYSFLGLNFDPSKMIDQESRLRDKAKNGVLSEYTKYKNAFESLKVPINHKIIVIIDDLDRCSPIKALKILEAIKLVLNQPGFLFFIGVSDKILEDYLKHIYIDEYKVNKEKLEELNYLDKIVQLPFMVGSHEKKMKNFMDKTIEDNPTLKSINGFAELSTIIVKATESNPRRIKRILNNIIMDKYLVDQFKPVLENPPKFEFIVVWILIQQIFPSYYTLLKEKENMVILKLIVENSKTLDTSVFKDEELEILKLFRRKKFLNFINSDIVLKWIENDNEREKTFNLSCQVTRIIPQELLDGVPQVIQELMKKGITEGMISQDEIMNALPHAEDDLDLLDDIYTRFLQLKIEIIDNLDKDNLSEYSKDIKEKYFNKALEKNPNNANWIGYYAIYLKNINKDYDEAEKYYKKALELDPDHANNNENYANFLDDIKKNYGEAEKYYTKALDLDPNDEDFNGNYANFLKNIKKDYEEAEKYYKKALELDPKSANRNGNYAYFLQYIKKDSTKAEKYYKKALELDPKSANINGNYAGFLFGQKRDEEAEKYWEPSFINLNLPSKNDLLLELQYYQFAHSQSQIVRDKAESEITRLLDEGVTSKGFDLSGNIERAILDNHPDIDKVIDYATKISVNIDYEHLRPKK